MKKTNKQIGLKKKDYMFYVILIAFTILFSINVLTYASNRFSRIKNEAIIEGQQEVYDKIISTIDTQGYIDITANIEDSPHLLRLAPYTLSKQQAILEFLNIILYNIDTQGNVEITYPINEFETESIILIPYDEFSHNIDFEDFKLNFDSEMLIDQSEIDAIYGIK